MEDLKECIKLHCSNIVLNYDQLNSVMKNIKK